MRMPRARDAVLPPAMGVGLKPPLSRGRCYSVSLRTTMLLVLLSGGGMGWAASEIRGAHAQRTAIQAFKNAGYSKPCFSGCVVLYSNPTLSDAAAAQGRAGWRERLGKRLGHDYFRDVVYLDLGGSSGRPSSGDPLGPIEAFPRLEYLKLQACGTTNADLTHLARLTHLRELIITASPVTDAGLAQLAGLTGLRRLRLNRCRITDVGLAHLAALTGLERLDVVSVSGQVTMTGIAKLQRALPSLRITLNSRSLPVASDPPLPE